MNITTASERGGRPHQEDRYAVSTGGKGTLLAVMDGHSGAGTAEFVAKNFGRVFASAREKSRPRKALLATFSELHLLTRRRKSGTTLSVVWIPERGWCAYVAVLGDSPVIIKNPGERPWLSPEHNVRSNLRERQAALRRGGEYSSGYLFVGDGEDGLQLSRSLGDVAHGKVLDRNPEVFSVSLKRKGVVLIASDGLLDPGHRRSSVQVKRLVQLIANGSDAKGLVRDALQRQTHDNVTAVLCMI